jgi:hypothetical protein
MTMTDNRTILRVICTSLNVSGIECELMRFDSDSSGLARMFYLQTAGNYSTNGRFSKYIRRKFPVSFNERQAGFSESLWT